MVGDTHGEWIRRLNTDSFPDQKKLTKEDHVLILGDFGIWDNSKAENYNLDWLEDKPFTTLFISGNHENYTYTTLAYEAGANEKAVSMRLGHASEQITRETYTHLRGKRKEEQDEVINKVRIE